MEKLPLGKGVSELVPQYRDALGCKLYTGSGVAPSTLASVGTAPFPRESGPSATLRLGKFHVQEGLDSFSRVSLSLCAIVRSDYATNYELEQAASKCTAASSILESWQQ